MEEMKGNVQRVVDSQPSPARWVSCCKAGRRAGRKKGDGREGERRREGGVVMGPALLLLILLL